MAETPAALTLADVARAADVSEITVSRILRNVGPISETTRRRVLDAVDQTGYVRNQIAGTLASATSNLIGVVIPSLSNIVFADVLRGIDAGLEPSGFRPVVGITDYKADAEEKLVTSLLAWKPAAIIIVGFDHTDITRRRLKQSRIRVVELMDIDSEPIDLAVGMSHRAAGLATGRHLIGRGYRRFGYVGHDWTTDRRARLRWDGLVQALEEAGLELVDQRLHGGPSSTQAGREALATLLQGAKHPDVVVFSNDDMAVGGVFHCIAEGIVLKRDLALFGFNGLDVGQALPKPLSTVRSNRFRIGKIAVEQILLRPERNGTPETINTGFEIVPGETA
ncbi:LacI family DNA-binding transcriptional regulator [Hyphomicrobiales bacterium BP6-180914]|uniref:LacI family DNA-binding transcriptional regulator n=1 Tax=Lichenifustis flavocetrariae TaxID=2949735 RepID=A0AA41Z3F1_9HYPH|nr:LacI family DNA-binding transcriptional regulator [Lichenifustis flavocetrariae]MCW6512322.1 LacI family DNA-binding transcriptional regulator [Lichenifustis flavocetrariae]